MENNNVEAWDIIDKWTEDGSYRHNQHQYICFPGESLSKMLEEYASLRVSEAVEATNKELAHLKEWHEPSMVDFWNEIQFQNISLEVKDKEIAELKAEYSRTWYNTDELYDFLRRKNYSPEISKELAYIWADDLNGAYRKGFEKAMHESKSELEQAKKENETNQGTSHGNLFNTLNALQGIESEDEIQKGFISAVNNSETFQKCKEMFESDMAGYNQLKNDPSSNVASYAFIAGYYHEMLTKIFSGSGAVSVSTEKEEKDI